MDIFYEWVGKIVAVGGGAAVIAYGIFVSLGRSWMESKFSARLETYKHEQTKELEEIRYRINSQFNRITKIHEKEIEVLPEAWVKLQRAVGQLNYFISPGRQYPNLNSMNEGQLEEFLAGSDFQDWEKNELRGAENKFQKYHERIFWHELHETRSLARAFHAYFQDNRIFFVADLKALFTKVDDLIWAAMTEKEIDHEMKDFNAERKTYKEVQGEIAPIVDAIEALVQKRLQYDHAL